MIKRLLEREWISSAQARAIEAFFVGTVITLLIGITDNVVLLLQGETLSWKAFFLAFILTTTTSIAMGFKKYLRDLQNDLTK